MNFTKKALKIYFATTFLAEMYFCIVGYGPKRNASQSSARKSWEFYPFTTENS
ncbi:hypothetical protein Pint_08163 [Pistacia integerrima]|uniref:Uncharacterized protein n=1 Tax=Pistacia integerrima TaxID=434235 RepID=A0ACC0XRZ4_9ROSI|nr:hypothetical protein Pint_08163 [Pistacia integerrima]